MDTITSKEALDKLLEGNRRFATSNAIHPHQNSDRLNETISGQLPFAAILTCADSKVSCTGNHL
jgi:carbonic anhydrase